MTDLEQPDDRGSKRVPSGTMTVDSGLAVSGAGGVPVAAILAGVADVLEEQTCVLDRAGRIVGTNRAWRRFAEDNGARPETVSPGVNYLSICHQGASTGYPEAGVMAVGIVDVLHNRRGEFEMEYPCHGPGVERWFRVTVRAFSVAGAVFVVVMHKNVTSWARRIRLQSRALAGIPSAVLIGDARRGGVPVVYANDSFARITGFTENGVRGCDLGRLGHDLVPAGGMDALLATALQGGTGREVLRGRRKDSTPIWTDVTAYPVKNDLGGIDHLVVTFVDVTAEVSAKEELEASLDREQTTLAFASVGTLDWNLDTGTVRLSSISERLWGAEGPDGDVSIDFLRRRIVEPDRAGFDRAVCDCLSGTRPLDIDFRIDTAGGRPRWLQVQGDAYVAEAGGARRLVCLCQDVTQRCEQVERFRHIASHDALTGLPNRMLFRDRLEQAIALARRGRQRLAVLFLDLDHFKHINDSLGHAAGDELLQLAAGRLRQCVRESDTVCRNGGDEFLVLLPALRAGDEAARVAGTIVEVLSDPYSVRGHDAVAPPSVGIAVYPEDGDSVDNLLTNADAALYHAKNTGRGRFQFFTAELNARERMRVSVTRDLRHAMAQAELQVHYQPRYDVSSRRLVGAEALLRWDHPRLGLLLPGDFVAVAEESDLILEIGDWVTSEVCAQQERWRNEGCVLVPVALNLSRRQLRDGRLADSLERAIEIHGVPAGALELELDDRIMMSEPEATLGAAMRLHALGVRLSLEGLGAGQTDLRHLTSYPLDMLGLDMSLVRELPGSLPGRLIIEAIITLGHGLNLRVRAKGVERAEELSSLQAAGCDHFQGFYGSRAVTPETFGRMLVRR